MTVAPVGTTFRKTQWLYKHLAACMAALFIIAAIVACGVIMTRQSPTANLQIGSRSFKLSVVSSPQDEALGLSNRTSLPSDQGMLFILDDTLADSCFWMKDMAFPLDIIWLDSHKQIVNLEQDLSPATYPRSFCSSVPAKYVIELNAGTARSIGLSEGQTLHF